MNRTLLTLLLGVALFVLAGCATRPVVDYDRDHDFSTYRTFALKEPPTASPDDAAAAAAAPLRNELNLRRLENSIREQLEARGFQPDTSGDPDFRVGYTGGTRERTEIYSTPHRGRYHSPTIETRRYTEGTLILDIHDGKDGRLVWRGWITKVVSAPDRAEAQIREAVQKIFARFPPGSEQAE